MSLGFVEDSEEEEDRDLPETQDLSAGKLRLPVDNPKSKRPLIEEVDPL